MNLERIISETIYIKNRKIEINNYIEDLIRNIDGLKDEEGCSLLMTANEIETVALLLCIFSINQYYKNLFEKTKVETVFNVGDILWLEHEKVEYLGAQCIKGENRYKVRKKGNIQKGIKCEEYSYLKEEEFKKLTPYLGEIKSLHSIKKTQYLDSIKLFEKLIRVECRENSYKTPEQLIFVFESKKEMKNILDTISFKINNELYKLQEIFPCKYYSDINKFEEFNNITKKEEELLIFTSRLDVANKILLKNKKCKSLILLGASCYKDYVNSVVERQINRVKSKKIKNLILYNNFNSMDVLMELIAENIDVYSWHNELNKSKPLYHKNIIIHDNDYNSMLIKIRKSLIEIFKSKDDIINKDSILIISFKLLKYFSDLSVPILSLDTEKNDEFGKINIDRLEVMLNETKHNISNNKLCTTLLGEFKKLYELLYKNNKKFDEINNIINNTYDDVVVVCSNNIEKKCLGKALSITNSNNIQIVTFREFDIHTKRKTVIYTTFFNKDKIDQTSFRGVNRIFNIFNYINAINYNKTIRFFNKCMDLIDTANLKNNRNGNIRLEEIKLDYREIYKDVLSKKNTINLENDILEENLISEEDVIDKFCEFNDFDNLKPIYDTEIKDEEIDKYLELKSQYSNSLTVYENNGISNVVMKVMFNKDNFSYLTEHFTSLCISNNDKVVEKSVNNLKIGDKIIFISTKSEDDLSELFNEIINSDIFREKYKKHYSNMKYWKKALLEYVNRYENFDFNLLSKEFSYYKVQKTGIAIRAWIYDEKIIGPREREAYKAIAGITMDKNLKEDWEEIYESCNIIRSFKTQFKKSFNNMIRNAFVGTSSQSDELEVLVCQVFGDLKKYTDIMEIKSLISINEKIPYNKTNIVLKE